VSARKTRVGEHSGMTPFRAGLIVALVTVVAVYMNFAKQLPWTQHYTVHAIVKTANNLKPNSHVRIAGVNVGKVSSIEQVGNQQAAEITMRIEDAGRPIHKDATLKIRPQLFLEGNFFVDLKPGSPGRPELESGDTIPIDHTASPVQFDQVLQTLQSDTRRDLRTLLAEFGNALTKYGGAEGFRRSFDEAVPAFRDSARVNDALQGTRVHDLSGVVKNFDKVAHGLARHPRDLQGLVTNFRIFAGSLAREDAALEAAIAELPGTLEEGRPALVNLNKALPPLRGLAQDILPGVRNSPQTLDALQPFISEGRRLVSRPELRGLVADLRPTVPALARLTSSSRPLFEQVRSLSSCFDNVVNPWSLKKVPDPELPAVGEIYKETAYGLTGIAGESRSGDANGEIIHVLGGGGPTTFAFGPESNFFGTSLFPILGQRPTIESSAKTPLEPNQPCENQELPNLDSGELGAPPAQSTPRNGGKKLSGSIDQKLYDLLSEIGSKAAYIQRDRANVQLLRAQGKIGQARDLLRSVDLRQKRFDEVWKPRLTKLFGLPKNLSRAAKERLARKANGL
jgi:phospholipid/cholesterol/gamma-HCH transport system substrate-binding protein